MSSQPWPVTLWATAICFSRKLPSTLPLQYQHKVGSVLSQILQSHPYNHEVWVGTRAREGSAASPACRAKCPSPYRTTAAEPKVLSPKVLRSLRWKGHRKGSPWAAIGRSQCGPVGFEANLCSLTYSFLLWSLVETELLSCNMKIITPPELALMKWGSKGSPRHGFGQAVNYQVHRLLNDACEKVA